TLVLSLEEFATRGPRVMLRIVIEDDDRRSAGRDGRMLYDELRDAHECELGDSQPEEEKRKNLAKALLLNEKLRKKSAGEPKAEDIIRTFRESLYVRGSN
ncbi:MAG: hypothetical protein QW760_04835, partial [Thermofilaceae archaeon]